MTTSLYPLTIACWLIACIPATAADLLLEVPLPALALKGAYVEAWTRVATSSTRLEPRVLSSTANSVVLLVPDGCDPTLTLVLHGASVISTSITPDSDECDGPATVVKMFDRAQVSGELSGLDARGHTRGHVAVRRCGPGGRPSDAPVLSVYPINVNEHGSWHATLPAVCLALELRVRPHAPVTWTSVRLTPMAHSRLGLRVLTRTAAARVHARDGQGRPIAGASAYAVNALAWTNVVDAVLGGGKPSGVPALTSGDGRALLDELSPGVARFIVLADGMAPGFSDAVSLEPGVVHEIPPVTLSHPRRLTVRIERDPSVSAELDVMASPIVAGRPMGGTGVVALGVDEGAEFGNLFAGTWRVTVFTRKEGFGQVAAEVDAVIGDSDAAISVQLFAGLFTGQLLRDGVPLAGRVEVRAAAGRFGVSGVAGEDGVFRVQLPGAGKYHVAYHGTGAEGAALNVQFDSPSEVVSVTLGSCRVSGRVLDAQGAPIAGAAVLLEYREPILIGLLRHMVRTDDDGAFTASGLPEGQWVVEASADERLSRTERIALRPRGSPPVVLTLRARRNVTGTVLTADGDRVPDIEGFVYLTRGDDPTLIRPVMFRTDEAGEFVVRLPEPLPRTLNVEVHGMERGLTAARADMAERIEVRLPRTTGSVAVHFEEPLDPADRTPRGLVLVGETGAYVSAIAARSQVTFSTDGRGLLLHIPHLAPGRWRLLWHMLGDPEPGLRQGDDPQRLAAEFTLRSGDVLSVSGR